MARINSMGLDDMFAAITAEGKATPQIMAKMVEAAGDVYAEEIRDQIVAYKIYDTGSTWWSIKRGRSTKQGDGVRLEVWPAGTRVDAKHPDGERAETVAFVAEYGVSTDPSAQERRRKRHREYKGGGTAPRPFMSRAAVIAAPKAEAAMLKVWERESKL